LLYVFYDLPVIQNRCWPWVNDARS